MGGKQMENEQTVQLLNYFLELLKVLGAAGITSVVVMPILVAFIVQSTWSRRMKEIVVGISCFIAAGFGLLATGQDMTDLVVVFPTMVFLTRKAYQTYWKQTGLAPWVERITNVNSEERYVPEESEYPQQTPQNTVFYKEGR